MPAHHLHAIVTHTRFLIVYAILSLSAGDAMAKDPLSSDQIKALMLKEITLYDDVDLAEGRTICAAGLMPTEVRKVAADQGTHPGTLPMCKGLLTESLKRDRGGHLYANYAVNDMTGKTVFSDEFDVSKILLNNEGATTFKRIREAAMADAQTYTSVRDRQKPLTAALAVDAGAYQGYLKPDATIAATQTDADIERTIEQCYQENADISRKACFLAGARFGQNVRRTVDAASR